MQVRAFDGEPLSRATQMDWSTPLDKKLFSQNKLLHIFIALRQGIRIEMSKIRKASVVLFIFFLVCLVFLSKDGLRKESAFLRSNCWFFFG